jgi:hypothetical protein
MADTTGGATVFNAVAIRDKLVVKNGKISVDALTANLNANVTISNVAPAAVTTATISAWLEIDVAGVAYYIPCWT